MEEFREVLCGVSCKQGRMPGAVGGRNTCCESHLGLMRIDRIRNGIIRL